MDQCIIKMLHIKTDGGIFDEIVDCTYVQSTIIHI
jgi:hypothetical protein